MWNGKLEFFGNPFIKPYTVIYINPTMPGMGDIKNKNSFANVARIGGYHWVEKTEHSFQSGEWTTSVESIWKANPQDSSDLPLIRIGYNSGPLTNNKDREAAIQAYDDAVEETNKVMNQPPVPGAP